MRDDFLTRDWADHHNRLSASIDKWVAAIGRGFARLNARQFDAPWKQRDAGPD